MFQKRIHATWAISEKFLENEKWVSCLPILKHVTTLSENMNCYITDFPKRFQKRIYATLAISEKFLQ